jgi:transposase
LIEQLPQETRRIIGRQRHKGLSGDFDPCFLSVKIQIEIKVARPIIKDLDNTLIRGSSKCKVMTTKYFIGGDISKSKIDFALVNDGLVLMSEQIIPNTKTALLKFLKKIIKEQEIRPEELLVCCENTGIYTKLLMGVCLDLGVFLWIENAVKIKRACADLRGKTDRKDAHRIAEYAVRYQDKAKRYVEPSQTVKDLNHQTKIRETLIEQKKGIMNQLREAKTHDKNMYNTLQKGYASVLKQLEASIKKVEKKISELTQSEASVQQNVELLTSIPGIGLQTALGFILYTNNFQTYNNAKQLACYAGVVPFSNQSGTTKKPDRVSHMSNQRLKKLLHTAALSATRANKDLKAYYIRKTSEGKNKMSVINAVRNKLVHRMCSIIKRQTPYAQELFTPINQEKLILAS